MAQTDKEFLIRVKADIDKALADLKKLPGEIQKTGNASEKASKDVTSMGKGMEFLTRAVSAYLSIETVTYIIQQADAFNTLNQRIRTATKDTGDYTEVQRELYRITQQNGAEFATSVSLFQSLARSAPELQATNTEVLKLVNTVQQLGVISGATQAAQQAGLLQFSQGLAAGVFRAEEFNSLLENIPEVANRIAKGMGVSVGQLRQMVLDGQLLSKDVFDSLLKQSQGINEEFKEIPDRVSRSSEKLGTSFDHMLSALDKAAGVTGFIARIYENVAKTFDDIAISLGEDQLAKLNLELEQTERYLEAIKKTDGGDSQARRLQEEQLKRIKKEIADIKALNEGGSDFVGPLRPAGAPTQALTDNNAPSAKEIAQQTQLEKLNTAIKEQGDLYGKTNEEIAVYKLQLAGATEADIQAARAIFAGIEATKQHNEAVAEGQRIYEATRTDAEKLATEIERLNRLYEQGAFGAVGSAEASDTRDRAIARAKADFSDLADAGEEANDRLIAATRGWGDQFTNTLADMVQKGKLDFASLADSIISDLLRIQIYQNITAPLFGSLGIPGFKLHSGGFVGSGTSQMVNPLIFAGAPRYHAGGWPGLRSDEVPVIAQKGEYILSKQQVAAMGASGGGNMSVRIENKGSPHQITDANITRDIAGPVLNIIIDDIDRGGPLRDRIRTIGQEG